MASRISKNLLSLLDGSQPDDEGDDFLGDGSQVGDYSPPTGFVPPPRYGAAGYLTPAAAAGGYEAAAGFLPPRAGRRTSPPATPFVVPAATEGLDLNSQAAAAFPGFNEYQRVLQSDEAPVRQRSGKHVVATKSTSRGAGGRGSTSNAGIPPRPARSGASRRGGGGRGGGVARTRSLPNVTRAQSASISVDNDEDCFYGSMSMTVDASNMFLNSDDAEGDSDENWIAATMDQWAEEDEEEDEEIAAVAKRRKNLILSAAELIGTYHLGNLTNRNEYRQAKETGLEWVIRTLANKAECYDMFRMEKPVFDSLHGLLVKYGLKSTRRMSSVECLALFLWMVGAPQSVRQARNRFVRSMETLHRKFDKVLECVVKMAGDIIQPLDPEFRTPHPRVRNPMFAPFFDNCIGAIDGTHIEVVVPKTELITHMNRKSKTSQNVLAVCDFDLRFTFVVAGWPGSVHDMRVFKAALDKFGRHYPHPPQGKFYVVDSGFSNQPGYLAPFKGTKYHFQEYNQGPPPRGKKETFNHRHSQVRNAIERCFGILKNKFRMLMHMPSYPPPKQSKIITACMAIHNFIRESKLEDRDFQECDEDDEFIPLVVEPSRFRRRRQRRRRASQARGQNASDDVNMNTFRDWIAEGLHRRR